ncbi:cytochrome P450 [Gonapodya prolifera JEL478]|uniref:Cytochrome P450 n=1 Tax=Gonapodya prolifera (strain JEL478) TaxID=1344416 RepID=A0A139A0S0_GONPJ|nr:cytochrome P450 [Gonapodya prolifera JEL478]|eukprot:KXS09953.1 cytochrome P450 [Gonapodya prolifera JEL478]
MIATLLLLVALVAAVYLYLAKKYEGRAIFSDPYIPGVTIGPTTHGLVPKFPWGHLRNALKSQPTRLDALVEFQESGQIDEVWQATIPGINIVGTLNVADLEHILKDPYTFVKGKAFKRNFSTLLGDGIFNSDGDHWKIQRKTASNIFNVKNFRDIYADVFIEESHLLTAHLLAAAEANAIVDLQDLLLRSTLDSFGRIALSTTFGCMDMQNASIEKGHYIMKNVPFMEAFDNTNNIIARRGPNPFWKLTEQLDGTAARVQKYVEIMDGVALKVISEKKRNLAQGRSSSDGLKFDLLDLFLQTTNDDGTELTFKQLRDVVLNFIIAGRDTTAQTLSWVFWRLAKHPNVEEKLREEIQQVLKGGEVTYDSFKSLVYAQAVFNETLRLHANVPSNRKEVTRDDVLPGTKTPVKKGTTVLIHPFVMGHSKKIWGDDATEFKPERWISADGSLRKENQFKWPVFNAGPRLCLGMNMATQEAVVFMTEIVRKFHLELVNEDDPKHWGNPETKKGRYGLALTLVMRGGVEFKVHPL